MFGNYTPDPNPFAPANTGSFIDQPVTSYVPPTMAEQLEGLSEYSTTPPKEFTSQFPTLTGEDLYPRSITGPPPPQNYGSGNMIQDVLRGAGQYYLGRENIQDVQELGRQSQEQFGVLAEQGREATQFKPYTVTSGLGSVGTDPTGGFAINLSPEQQAIQQQLQGQAQGLFGQVGQDPAAQQASIYEQIRATQRPEEERQRLATEARMLSQGRLGVSSSQFGGGSPELFAQETARQEAMNRANVGARQQALAEQRQSLAGAQGLLTSSYQPQQQALNMLQASAVPAGYADVGRRVGQEAAGQLLQSGLESRLQSEQLANQLRLQQQQGLLSSAFGSPATVGQRATVAGMPTGSLRDMAEAALRQQAAGAVGGLFSKLFGGG
jgi:hypothetical protein